MHSVLIDGIEYIPRAKSAACAKASTLAARLKIWHRHWKLIDGGGDSALQLLRFGAAGQGRWPGVRP